VNPYITYRLTIAQIDELLRQTSSQRRARRTRWSRRRRWLRLRLPSLGVSRWPRERVA
jgi:hypothetical protein